MTHPPIDSQITFLYTHNLAQTAHFYEEIMGLQLKLDQGTCRIYQVSQDGYLGFCKRTNAAAPSAEPDTPHVILTMVVPNVDTWYQYLKEQDVRLEKPPATNHDYKIYHCFLRDPNGYLLEIQQFLHPF
jgi:catechol 2,3-dioxygenase-like lactoylglutathione lyase family enzyme